MLNEYQNNYIWQNNPDEIKLRSDLLVTNRVIGLLGDITGMKIIDAGCGNGRVSRLMVKAGAFVVGVDKIEDQITIAKNINPQPDIKYLVGDILNLDELNLPNDFDVGLSLMTFLYLDNNEFIRAVQQIRNHLKSGARFIYGDINPFRFRSNNNNAKIEKLEAELPTLNGEIFRTEFYKHPHSFVIESFLNNGFRILSEIKPMETQAELEQYESLFPKETIGKGQYIIIDMEAV